MNVGRYLRGEDRHVGTSRIEKPRATAFTIGGKYNWKGQPERLIYLGRNWSGNGYWHQFKKIDDPRPVWCEVLDSDLHMIEETCAPRATQPADAEGAGSTT